MKITIEVNDNDSVLQAAKALLKVTHTTRPRDRGLFPLDSGWKGMHYIDQVDLMNAADNLHKAVENYGTIQTTKRRS